RARLIEEPSSEPEASGSPCDAPECGQLLRGEFLHPARNDIRPTADIWARLLAVDIVALVVALPIILAGAEVFTNGVEWVGEGFGLSEGAVGSVLAAIGTALPETILPLVAIIVGHHHVGDEVGIGAILGSPLMLSTLAVCILGITVLASRRRS